MKIKPLYDYIYAKRLQPEEKTSGGIIIPDTAKEKRLEVEIIETGEGKLLEDGTIKPLKVKKGDIVLVGKYSGTEFKQEYDEEYIFIKEENILAIIEK